MSDLELLRRFASARMPVRLVTAEDFKGAQALQALGYVRIGMPPVHKGRGSYGQKDPAQVLAITPAGRRAISA
jgi:hypothetical protein